MATAVRNSSARLIAAPATIAVADDADVRRSEEPINMLTHGLGLVLSLAGGYWLCTAAWQAGGLLRIVGCTVYAASLIAVYLFSTLSHTFETGEARQRFRALDQAFIYFLIVGTYTPAALMFLHGGLHSALLAVMWGVAIFGFLSKTIWRHRINSISTASYLALGWLPVLSIPSAWMIMPTAAVALFAAGGLSYTVGVAFLLNDRRVPYFHAVWHVLVMAGSAFHFAAIYAYVALPNVA
ncbi:MAG: hemolysin III family protein [Pirellulales bacterium]